MKAILSIILVAMSMCKVDIAYSGQPQWLLWGNPTYIRYDQSGHVWINCNPQNELWRLGYPGLSKPERVPEKKEVRIKPNLLFWRQKDPLAGMPLAVVCVTDPKRRLKLINVEQSINELRAANIESRIWPHLGILYIGTVADEEGWEITLHDELVEGYVDLGRFVQPGDVVGLSLVVTGMERGIELARQAKRLGARYVIAGNDSAIFRTNQLLRLPDHPIDAVFTTNSLTAVRRFLREIESVELGAISIPGVAIVPSDVDRSNEQSVLKAEHTMRTQLRRKGEFNPQDVFIVPKLTLYTGAYWQKVWGNYRTVFGHKHQNPSEVRNAIALFAQGCTRASSNEMCSYCTIAGASDVRMPSREYLAQVVEVYRSFGIDYVFNATDSALEMRAVARALKDVGAFFPEGLMIYGRAWGLAHHPQLIDEWISLTGGRLLVNVGMDSGDEGILSRGVIKTLCTGSRLEENRQAVRNIAASGAHLHFSLIFGSPGETRESCERSLEFFEWTRATLGTQLDQCETDLYWLNHGSPASRVFRDYAYAQQLASLAGKEISRDTWKQRFHRHRDTLVVPWECEEAWYECFTSITVEEAQRHNAYVSQAMAAHEGAAPGRSDMCRTAFRPA